MARAPRLPEKLGYLDPVRKGLAALPLEELNEDMDTAPFEKALRERTKGLPVEEATRVLREDRDELQRWLARPGNENNPLHFLYGFLLIAADSIDELLHPPPEPPPPGAIEMKFPPGGRAKKRDTAWEVRLRGVALLLFPNDKTGFDLHIETFNVAAGLEKGAAVWAITPVVFGRVRGVKFVRVASALRLKEVHYALEVPGGYCTGEITGPGTDWDESNLEQCFGSLRLVRQIGRAHV